MAYNEESGGNHTLFDIDDTGDYQDGSNVVFRKARVKKSGERLGAAERKLAEFQEILDLKDVIINQFESQLLTDEIDLKRLAKSKTRIRGIEN